MSFRSHWAPALFTFTVVFAFPESEAQETDATIQRRYTEAVTDSPKDDAPMSWQAAPSVITDMRTPASAIATQRHFTGDYTEPKSPTPLTQQIPELDNQLSQLDPFFRDTDIVLNVRSGFFREENEAADPLTSAWALGGNLIYKSGWFKDFMLIGAGFYTSSGIYKPYGQAGNLLLHETPDGGQRSINLLGQAYVEFKHDIYRVKLYRQALDTPFINEHYDRMVPQLFEAYVIGTKGFQPNEKGMDLKRTPENPVNFLAGYVAREHKRDSTNFVPMSSVATKDQTHLDRGVAMGGIQVTPTHNIGLSLWEYYGFDMFNTIYAEGEFDFPLANSDWAFKFASQFMDQRSVGDAIAGEWSSQVVGLLAGASYQGFSLSLRGNYNFEGVGTNPQGASHQFGMESSWGRYPGFNKSTVLNFNYPESAIMGIFGSYDFGHLSEHTKGLKLSASYVYADRKSQGLAAGPDTSELNIIFQYEVPAVKGLFLDIRGAWTSNYDLPGSYLPSINDYRIILNYRIPLL